MAYFEFSGEASVSRRLGSNASYPVVRVILEAKRQAQSDWALRNLSDMCRSSMYDIVLLLVPHTLSCSLIILMTRHESRHESCKTACHERLWTLDLHPAISNLALPSGLLLSDADDRVPQPFALKMAFASTGKLHYFKMFPGDIRSGKHPCHFFFPGIIVDMFRPALMICVVRGATEHREDEASVQYVYIS